jgi:hypothetical protein
MYRVRYGFDAMSSVRVEAGPELEKVIFAWLKQTPVAIGGRMIQGKHIIDIKPDYHFYTGWYDNYQPTSGDDWKQIERDCPPELARLFGQYVERVRQLIETQRTDLIGKGPAIEPEKQPERIGSTFAQQVLAAKS